MSIVAGHAVMEPASTRTKEKFYHSLQSAVARVHAKECLFIMSDANACTGKRGDGRGIEEVLGAYRRNELNDNDEHLLQFARTTSHSSITFQYP